MKLLFVYRARMVGRNGDERLVHLLSLPHKGDMVTDKTTQEQWEVLSVELEGWQEIQAWKGSPEDSQLTVKVRPWPSRKPEPPEPVVVVESHART